MFPKYTSLSLLMTHYDCVPKAAGEVHKRAITAPKKRLYKK